MGRVEELGSEWEQVLRAHGHRMTGQRRAILEAVARLGHATPEEIAVEGAADLSTVYRALELMEDLKLVRHAHPSHGSPVWSLTSEAPHAHLVCSRCGRLDELPADAGGELLSVVSRSVGFHVDLAHLTLAGTCSACSVSRR